MVMYTTYTVTYRPDPVPGAKLTLPVMGETLTEVLERLPPTVPLRGSQYVCLECVVMTTQIIPNSGSFPLLGNLSLCRAELWHIWELLICGESLVVMADTPQQASSCVMSCLELLRPMPYAGDIRPYFTIHDANFSTFADCSDGVCRIVRSSF